MVVGVAGSGAAEEIYGGVGVIEAFPSGDSEFVGDFVGAFGAFELLEEGGGGLVILELDVEFGELELDFFFVRGLDTAVEGFLEFGGSFLGVGEDGVEDEGAAVAGEGSEVGDFGLDGVYMLEDEGGLVGAEVEGEEVEDEGIDPEEAGFGEVWEELEDFFGVEEADGPLLVFDDGDFGNLEVGFDVVGILEDEGFVEVVGFLEDLDTAGVFLPSGGMCGDGVEDAEGLEGEGDLLMREEGVEEDEGAVLELGLVEFGDEGEGLGGVAGGLGGIFEDAKGEFDAGDIGAREEGIEVVPICVGVVGVVVEDVHNEKCEQGGCLVRWGLVYFFDIVNVFDEGLVGGVGGGIIGVFESGDEEFVFEFGEVIFARHGEVGGVWGGIRDLGKVEDEGFLGEFVVDGSVDDGYADEVDGEGGHEVGAFVADAEDGIEGVDGIDAAGVIGPEFDFIAVVFAPVAGGMDAIAVDYKVFGGDEFFLEL